LKAKPAKAKQPSKPQSKAKEKPLKAAVKTKVSSTAAKKTAPAKTAAKTLGKTVSKAVAKAVKKPAAKSAHPVAKAQAVPAKKATASAKPPINKSVPQDSGLAAHAGTAKTKAPAKSDPSMQVKPQAKPEPQPAPTVITPASALAVAQRPGRPSSRLASLTVPSMAQSVASTAAKASYSQFPSAPLIVPPLPSATKKDPKLVNNWKTKPIDQLTDAELLAMPDSEYMNEKQMGAFRLKLSLLKQEILNSAGETTEHLREDTVVVPDPADRATIEEEHALELRTRDRERKLLKKIEQSIARIDAGDYGYCDETGEPIGVGRLLARPTATLSLEAQQRRELKQKMFGD
jgi:DnaK suppressor protein